MVYLFRPNPEFGAAISGGHGVRQFTRKRAEAIAEYARDAFLMQVRHTHMVTPPPYADSFFIQEKHGFFTYMVGNDDPAAIMVEFGAHPGGGQTFVLAYHPLAKGIDRAKSDA